MDIFLTIYRGADIVISTFYNIMLLEYGDFQSFLFGTYTLEFETLIQSISMSLDISFTGIGLVDVVLNALLSLLSNLFQPLPIFYQYNVGFMDNVPFYLCFISFFVHGLLILGLIKLVSFVIELIPFE